MIQGWGATSRQRIAVSGISISIHAPRAGSDCADRMHRTQRQISIHAPRAGSDTVFRMRHLSRCHFNPRSPCGERQNSCTDPANQRQISIHAPRAGSDKMTHSYAQPQPEFQSTLPVRGATLSTTLHTTFLLFQSTLPVRGATSLCRSLQH